MTATDILVQIAAGLGGLALGALLFFPDVLTSMARELWQRITRKSK